MHVFDIENTELGSQTTYGAYVHTNDRFATHEAKNMNYLQHVT